MTDASAELELEKLTETLVVRISPTDMAQVDRLAGTIFPMIPMSRADVIRWLIRKSAQVQA